MVVIKESGSAPIANPISLILGRSNVKNFQISSPSKMSYFLQREGEGENENENGTSENGTRTSHQDTFLMYSHRPPSKFGKSKRAGI